MIGTGLSDGETWHRCTALAACSGSSRRCTGPCPDRISLTLEIHQWRGRLPLGDAAGLFTHWRNLTNAERTNAWLGVIAENAILVHAALDQAEHPRG